MLPGRAPRAYSCGVPFLFVPVRDREAIARAKIRPDLWEKSVSQWWAPSVFVMGRPSLIELEADKSDGRITAVRVGGRSVLMSEGWINLD